MNYINEYKMIYYNFSKWRVSVTAAMEQPQPLTEEMVRQATLQVIKNTLELGENPYAQATFVEEDGLHCWTETQPQPNKENKEELNDPQNMNQLANWIMATEEMQQAIMMFDRQLPQDNKENEIQVLELSAEQLSELNVQTLLYNLIPSEGDWQ